MCTPQITLQNVSVTVDLSSANLTSVTPTANLTTSDPFTTSLVGNMTTPPFNGQAYNGLNWPTSQLVVDPFVQSRAVSIQTLLPAAIFENAVQSPEGLTNAFANNLFATLSATVYVIPLSCALLLKPC